ncbi:MAG: hypothetical protein QM628_10105 [Propionicimonas sp.]
MVHPLERADGRSLDTLARLGRLFVAVVSDSLDKVGCRNNVLAPHIRPLQPGSRLAGFAATVELAEVTAPPAPSDSYRGEMSAIEALQPGDVMVVSSCPGAYWGELLTIASLSRGARGIIADAFTRDVAAINELGFPTFVAGISAQDSLGRTDVVSHGGAVSCGGVTVSQGDLIIADIDGVAIIPTEVAEEVLALSEARVSIESDMRAQLRQGTRITDAFHTFGIL